MNIDKNDPRITAYALGELEGTEHAEIETLVQQNAELTKLVEEVRATARLLKQELADEPLVGLTPGQRRLVETKAAERNGRDTTAPRRPLILRFAKPILALAACLALGLCIWELFVPTLSRARSRSSQLAQTLPADSPRSGITPAEGRTKAEAERGGISRELRKDDNYGYTQAGATPQDGIQVNDGCSFEAPGLPLPPPQDQQPRMVQVQTLDDQGQTTLHSFVAGVMHRYYERQCPSFNTESYDFIESNGFKRVADHPLSTFSIDVDTASYANVRRFLSQGQMPPAGAVRIEEMVNYFDYDYPPPTGDDPFSVNVEIADCPWQPDHRLARIGLKGYEVTWDETPPSNLVFLIDVSGSMKSPDKLPLLKEAMKLLVEQLGEHDSIALTVYAGASGLVLPSTTGANKGAILDALDRLNAGGSTNGGAGIKLAYDTAMANFIPGGVNRVILATDGDFNVGTTSRSDLTQLIEDKAKSGVFLSVLGFGTGNYKDSQLEQLADKGNGNYAYIDSLNEARKVLVTEMGGTLVTIAKDVKIQIEFNPAQVSAYRLIGYENRLLAKEDFNDDTKDAGEIGAGHTVTAFYEIVPGGVEVETPGVDPLEYQPTATAESETALPEELSGTMMTVKLRYKEPDGDTSKLMKVRVADAGLTLAEASDDFTFATAVASFGMLLRGSEHVPGFTYGAVLEMAQSSRGEDPNGYRAEFAQLVQRAEELHAITYPSTP